MAESKKPTGRPSIYSEELANRICDVVAANPMGLPKICEKYPDLPHPDTIREWRWTKDGFSLKYARAKALQAEMMAESLEDVIDETEKAVWFDHGVPKIDSGIIAQARLRVDTRKWFASKLAPKIYGDQKRVEELEGENERVKAELQALRDKLNKANVSEY
jgi:hypothetical protein